jgi:hypothetical protein
MIEINTLKHKKHKKGGNVFYKSQSKPWFVSHEPFCIINYFRKKINEDGSWDTNQGQDKTFNFPTAL